MTTLGDIFNPFKRDTWVYVDNDDDIDYFTVYPYRIADNDRITKTKTEYIENGKKNNRISYKVLKFQN